MVGVDAPSPAPALCAAGPAAGNALPELPPALVCMVRTPLPTTDLQVLVCIMLGTLQVLLASCAQLLLQQVLHCLSCILSLYAASASSAQDQNAEALFPNLQLRDKSC